MTEQSTVEQVSYQTHADHAMHQSRHHGRRDGTTVSEYMESLLVTVILALFGTTFVVQAFKIPSPSMEKTEVPSQTAGRSLDLEAGLEFAPAAHTLSRGKVTGPETTVLLNLE